MNRRLDECKMVQTEIDEARHRFYSDLIYSHCAHCSECARYMEQTDRLIQLVSGYKISTPMDFDRRLFERVAELKGRKNWLENFMTLSAGLRLTAGAMAAALVVFAVYSEGLHSRLIPKKPSPVAVEVKPPIVKIPVEENPTVEAVAVAVPQPSETVVPVTVKSRTKSPIASRDIRFVMSDGKTVLPVSAVVIGAKPVVDISDMIASDSDGALSEDAAIF